MNQEPLIDASLVFLHAFISAKYDVMNEPEAHVDAAVPLAKMLYETSRSTKIKRTVRVERPPCKTAARGLSER